MAFFRKEIAFSLLTNLFHYYAFAIYAFSAVILAPKFFHTQSEELTSMLAVISISLTVIIRPLGGFIFGHIGDLYGRKTAILLSLFIVTLSTSAIGLLPTYGFAGMISTFFLILCLFIQSMCIGGQYTGALVYIQEHAPYNKAGFACGLLGAIGVVGTFLGTLTSYTLYHFNEFDWMWRVSFLAILPLGFILLYFVASMKESPMFLTNQEKRAKKDLPFFYILKNQKRPLFFSICLSSIPVSFLYLSVVYVPNFILTKEVTENPSEILGISAFSQAICILFNVLIGFLGDKIGREISVKLANFALFVVPYLVFQSAILLSPVAAILFISLLFVFLGAFYVGPGMAYLTEKFSTFERCTGVGLGVTIGGGIGTLSPFICIMLQNYCDKMMALFYYLIFLALLGLITLVIVPRSESASFEEKKLAA
ncbi:MAG: MFS transporter [Alphaproteobacteria bacterium]|nr:MFS transporter [Alphaproteobacteria bacterium]